MIRVTAIIAGVPFVGFARDELELRAIRRTLDHDPPIQLTAREFTRPQGPAIIELPAGGRLVDMDPADG